MLLLVDLIAPLLRCLLRDLLNYENDDRLQRRHYGAVVNRTVHHCEVLFLPSIALIFDGDLSKNEATRKALIAAVRAQHRRIILLQAGMNHQDS